MHRVSAEIPRVVVSISVHVTLNRFESKIINSSLLIYATIFCFIRFICCYYVI